MATIVLIHGSWLNAWCWNKVAPMIEADGHRVYAPDLAGHGSDQTHPSQVTLQSYTDHIGRLLDLLAAPAVLVGQGMAGVIISEAAERWPSKVKHLVYVAAFLLQNGHSILDVVKKDSIANFGSNMRPIETEQSITIDPDALQSAFFADCSEADSHTAIHLSRPEPMKPIVTPVTVTDQNFGSVPRSYIHTANDHALSTIVQQKMVEESPCQAVTTIDTGHCPFIARPDIFVNALLSLPL